MTDNEYTTPPRLVCKTDALGVITETWANIIPGDDGLHEGVTYTCIDGEIVTAQAVRVVGPVR